MSEYDWHPVVPLRWGVTGNLQQQFKRRVSNSRGIWYDEYEWRDVPRQPVDDIPLIKYPAQETSVPRGKPCTCPDTSASACGVERGHRLGELWHCRRAAENR